MDSNGAHAHAWAEAFRRNGFPVTYEEVRRLIGMGTDKLVPKLSGVKKGDPRYRRISELHGAIFMHDYFRKIKPLPRALDLLVDLKNRGLRLGIASSAKKEDLDRLLDLLGARELFDPFPTTKNVKESKPDPDLIQKALQYLKVGRGEAVYIGDTPFDVEAAKKTGVRVIAVRCGGWMDSDLHAAEIYDDPADILEHLQNDKIPGFRIPALKKN